MLDKMTQRLNFHGDALVLRAERQRTIASNIANADTPGYVARDFKFGDALREAAKMNAGNGAQALRTAGGTPTSGAAVAAVAAAGASRHIPISPDSSTSSIDKYGALGYAVQTQPSLDNNTVDLDRERANFVDNSVRYEATLRFINGNAKTMLSAIQGQ